MERPSSGATFTRGRQACGVATPWPYYGRDFDPGDGAARRGLLLGG